MSEEKATTVQEQQQELNDQMLIRREKLAQYEADGVYPFGQRFVVQQHAATIKDNFRDF